MSSVLSLVIVIWAVFTLPTGILAADVSACYATEARSDSAHLLSCSLSGSLGERKVKYPLQTDYSLREQWVLFICQAREPGL